MLPVTQLCKLKTASVFTCYPAKFSIIATWQQYFNKYSKSHFFTFFPQQYQATTNETHFLWHCHIKSLVANFCQSYNDYFSKLAKIWQ